MNVVSFSPICLEAISRPSSAPLVAWNLSPWWPPFKPGSNAHTAPQTVAGWPLGAQQTTTASMLGAGKQNMSLSSASKVFKWNLISEMRRQRFGGLWMHFWPKGGGRSQGFCCLMFVLHIQQIQNDNAAADPVPSWAIWDALLPGWPSDSSALASKLGDLAGNCQGRVHIKGGPHSGPMEAWMLLSVWTNDYISSFRSWWLQKDLFSIAKQKDNNEIKQMKLFCRERGAGKLIFHWAHSGGQHIEMLTSLESQFGVYQETCLLFLGGYIAEIQQSCCCHIRRFFGFIYFF